MAKVKQYLLSITILALLSGHAQASSWDLDGNNEVDALTDGLLLLRHTFDLSGQSLMDGAVAVNATLSHAQIEEKIANAYAISDIDGNGEVDALTDALILLRYLFDLRGDSLLSDAVALDASRDSSTDIEQYIATHMSFDDGSSGDSGSGDSGSGDISGTEKGPAEFTEAFGGTTSEGEVFTFPTGAASWAGFANMKMDMYPFTFVDGGSVNFSGSVPSGGSVDVRFRFEFQPHPDDAPAYDTQTVTISGATDTNYSISIPTQGSKTFSNLIMYVVEQDVPVKVTNIVVTESSGSADDNAGDTDSGDTGSGDTGSGDPVYTPADGFAITEAFGGTTIGDGTLLTFPAGAEEWAGFANMNTSLYPISLSQASLITFTAAIPAGGSADVRFRFEKNPHPDVDPAFDTASVTVTGDQAASYSVSVPSQGNNTFRSFIVYLDTRDVAVEISDIVISVDPDGGDTGSGDTGSGDTGSGDTGSGDTGSGDTGSGDTGSGDTGSGDTGSGDTGSGDSVGTVSDVAVIDEAFGGATYEGETFTFPSGAEAWAGFANMNTSLYPLIFEDGGSLSFTGSVPSGGSVNVRFRFEFMPYPDVDPAYDTSTVTVSGADEASYSVSIPSQGSKTFSNLILYVVDRNAPVSVSNLVVTTTGDAGGSVTGIESPTDYNVIPYGAGSIGDTIYTSNHRCKSDYGQWVENAGVISTESAVQARGCNQSTGIPTGNVTKLYPQLAGPAASKPTQTHKWWGSLSFLGEMTVGDAGDSAYITPDPISARITNKGVRVGSIPGGMRLIHGGQYYYPIPAHADEVFDGIAVGNSSYSNLEAYTKDFSEGSVTVLWKSGNTDVMEATFVHGSPYVYFKAYTGNLVVRTLRSNGSEKGTFYNQGNTLGLWTNVAGVANNFLVVGEGATTFSNTTGSEIGVNNSAKELTLVYLPHSGVGSASSAMINKFASKARNKVAAVDIDYQVNRATNEISVTHSYLNDQGTPVDTFVGLHPLHWKNTSQATSSYKIRSARGMLKFADVSQFNYQIPYVGVLPAMPTIDGSFDQATLESLVRDFANTSPDAWNTYTDTYWSGKNYGKVAELAAIARSTGMQSEANQLIDWLKVELSDWFTAESDGQLKTKKYFVYDSDWNTLFGFDEAYGAHQRIADHHFHYGYFVRAAAEICRVDAAWCGQDQYGPMIELLIRDYAADKDDSLFPHMRNFDPANGFSWADGKMNFIRGNNNESTSEAATAYGAIILYGLATGNDDLVEKGMYLHASTGAAYWEYWNNLDGYNNVSADADNFYPGYAHLTTSIIWGDGVDFATWFSGAYAHILGIQGLPSSPLIFHVGIHPEYMEDYVSLGLRESSNDKPSGLVDDQWRDLWWNLWAMTDADAAVADYNSVSSYQPEQGESKAHTYHWINTFKALGHLAMGTGELTSDHPAAVAFDKNGVRTYVVYNFTDQAKTVTYSDGKSVNASPLGFTID
jgi:endoglucanase Acf2